MPYQFDLNLSELQFLITQMDISHTNHKPVPEATKNPSDDFRKNELDQENNSKESTKDEQQAEKTGSSFASSFA